MRFKLLILAFKPQIILQTFEELKKMIEYNVNDPELEGVALNSIKQEGVIWLIRTCFNWLTEEVIPDCINTLLNNGRALTAKEVGWE